MRVELYLYDIIRRPGDKALPNGPLFDHYLYPLPHGYVEVEKFDPEEIFHLCNWSHWLPERPVNLHSSIKSCGHGLMMINPENNQRYLAKSMGWLIGDEKIIDTYVKDNRYRLYWR